MKNGDPLVSVIMPVYNSEDFLYEAIKSILKQTYSNIELIIIDDGSTDGSKKIIDELASQDSRIKSIFRENRGLIKTLNQAISIATGKYIARMDSDDISAPERLEKQIFFLEDNKTHALVGSCFSKINANSEYIGDTSLFLSDKKIRSAFFVGNQVCHPSVLINRDLVGDELYYKEEWDTAEDFELWLRISINHKLANLPENLLKYRVHENSISSTKVNRQLIQTNRLRELYFKDTNDQFLVRIIQKESRLYNKGKLLNKFGKLILALEFILSRLPIKIGSIIFTLKLAFKLIMKNDHNDYQRK